MKRSTHEHVRPVLPSTPYPAAIITPCVRLYFRFPLSYRGVEELIFERGAIVSYETIRQWCLKLGSAIAAELRRRRPQPKGTWHLDELRITMNGTAYWLWRAVDADGMVLDILVQQRRWCSSAGPKKPPRRSSDARWRPIPRNLASR